MCDLKDARIAQNLAADALTVACLSLCPDEVGASLRTAYDGVLIERIPERFKELLAKLK